MISAMVLAQPSDSQGFGFRGLGFEALGLRVFGGNRVITWHRNHGSRVFGACMALLPVVGYQKPAVQTSDLKT